MEIVLRAKNKFEFMDETMPKLEKNDHKYLTWRRCNKMIVF